MTDGWIGVDLDGTLAEYDRWRGPEHIGEPIAPMLKRVQEWMLEGRTVKLFTARVSGTPKDAAVALEFIRRWLNQHGLGAIDVTNVKDYGMIELWDDRAVQVIPNTGLRADGLR
jgi:hypothetical protein